MSKPKKYVYFISYSLFKGTSTIVGRCEYTANHPIQRIEEIASIEKEIWTLHGGDNAIALNFILLRTE